MIIYHRLRKILEAQLNNLDELIKIMNIVEILIV